jgi:preprotein translocase SecF subunit
MEWIKPKIDIDFMKAAKYWVPFSVVLTVVSLLITLVFGLDMGIDFKGGTKVIVAFKSGAGVDRGKIKSVVQELVAKQTGDTTSQVEVQDFDVGGAGGSETEKFQIFAELESLLTPLKKLEIAKALERHFGKGTDVDIPSEAGDKLYIRLPMEWPLDAAKEEISKVMKELGQSSVAIVSDKEERILMDMYREKDLLLSAEDEAVKMEAMRVEEEAKKKIQALEDERFTIEVQAAKDQFRDALKLAFGDAFVEVLSTASVSPSVGKELFETGLLALLYAIIGILIYIALRFDAKFAPGAVACLVHDVIATMGFLVVADIKFTLPIVAALLAIIGYDINDTIVVYDRIRENVRKGIGDMTKTVNQSINEVLSRTILTSFTTLLVLTSVIFLGGGTVKDFAMVMFVGVILGTYSSIFVASPLTIYLDKVLRRRALAK